MEIRQHLVLLLESLVEVTVELSVQYRYSVSRQSVIKTHTNIIYTHIVNEEMIQELLSQLLADFRVEISNFMRPNYL